MSDLGHCRKGQICSSMIFEQLEERIVLDGAVDDMSCSADGFSAQAVDDADWNTGSDAVAADTVLTGSGMDELSLALESGTEWLPDGTWHWWQTDWDTTTGNGSEFHSWQDGSWSVHYVQWDDAVNGKDTHNGFEYNRLRDGSYTYDYIQWDAQNNGAEYHDASGVYTYEAHQWNDGVGYDYTDANHVWTFTYRGVDEQARNVSYDARSDGFSLYQVSGDDGTAVEQTNVAPEVWKFESVTPGDNPGDVVTLVQYSNGYSEYTYTWATGEEFTTTTEAKEQIVEIAGETFSVVTLSGPAQTGSSQVGGHVASLDTVYYTPNDTINEIVWGWDKGMNTINCDDLNHWFIIHGGAYGNVITGGLGNDTIYGGDGDDFINGGGGSDTIYANGGNDQVYGYKYPYDGEGVDGNDIIFLGAGNDGCLGGDGNDQIFGDAGEDLISGNMGNDTLFGGADKDLMWGEDGDDVMYGDGGDDAMDGGKGNDTIFGGTGDDIIGGLKGDDRLYGEEGNDNLEGNDGNDSMWGGPGDDFMAGDIVGDPSNAGNDVMFGGEGNDRIYGNEGDDYIEGGAATNAPQFPETSEEFSQFKYYDTILGGEGNDIIYGDYYMVDGAGYDIHVMHGYETGKNGWVGDHDEIDGGTGLDYIYGGPGTDKIEASEARIKKTPEIDHVYLDVDDLKVLNPPASIDDIDIVTML